jgi:DNA topoisomerase-1
METATEIKLPKRKLASLFKDNVKSAEAVNLVYITDQQPGISRKRKQEHFVYLLNGKPVKDPDTLRRIKGLVIPPAWEEVWICATHDGHLQATGLDLKKRKQYKYHPLWNSLRNQTKFIHLYEFGKALPAIRKQLQKDLAKRGLPLEKVLATIVSVMQFTCIRVGNSQYEQLYGSFGLTTLKDKHVKFDGEKVQFTFVGKKGVHQDIGLNSKRLANIVKQCRDIPGKELFQYYDDKGQRHPIDSGMVNNYIREISGGSFTAKDFRTWAGTLHAIEAFKEMGCSDTAAGTKKNIVAALDAVAKQLGNTRTVCKKYYVHPMVIDHYTNKTINKYLDKLDITASDSETELTSGEQVLMSMLADGGATVIAA